MRKNNGKRVSSNQGTYESCTTLKKALETITYWSEFYKFDIVEAWVDVVDTDYNHHRIDCYHCWVGYEDEEPIIGDPYLKEDK